MHSAALPAMLSSERDTQAEPGKVGLGGLVEQLRLEEREPGLELADDALAVELPLRVAVGESVIKC